MKFSIRNKQILEISGKPMKNHYEYPVLHTLCGLAWLDAGSQPSSQNLVKIGWNYASSLSDITWSLSIVRLLTSTINCLYPWTHNLAGIYRSFEISALIDFEHSVSSFHRPIILNSILVMQWANSKAFKVGTYVLTIRIGQDRKNSSEIKIIALRIILRFLERNFGTIGM